MQLLGERDDDLVVEDPRLRRAEGELADENEPDRDDRLSQPFIVSVRVTGAVSPGPSLVRDRPARSKSRGSGWPPASPSTVTGSRPSFVREKV